MVWANQKGGAGKSTLCIAFADLWVKMTGRDVVVIDADPQRTLYKVHMKDIEENPGIDPLYHVYPFGDIDDADKTVGMMNKARLQNCDIIFVDPDNGLIVPSADGTPKSNKFVLPFELSEYYRAGASVIYYQHKARRSDEFYIEQNNQLVESGGFFGAKSLGLKFRTTSQRYYFFLVQPSHAEAMVRCIEQMISTPWKNHFEIL